MTEVAESTGNASEPKLKAGVLLQKAYDATVADRLIPGGGSTACIAVGQTNGNLEVAK